MDNDGFGCRLLECHEDSQQTHKRFGVHDLLGILPHLRRAGRREGAESQSSLDRRPFEDLVEQAQHAVSQATHRVDETSIYKVQAEKNSCPTAETIKLQGTRGGLDVFRWLPGGIGKTKQRRFGHSRRRIRGHGP